MPRRRALEVTCYRAVYQEYRSDPLPSRSRSGRFHGPGTPGSVTYLAATRETAWKEVTTRWGANPEAYWMVTVKARLTRVADLTDPRAQAQYGVDERALTDANMGRCRDLADRLRAEGFEGIWTFSRADRPDGRQLVVFLDRLGSKARVSVEEVEPLKDLEPLA